MAKPIVTEKKASQTAFRTAANKKRRADIREKKAKDPKRIAKSQARKEAAVMRNRERAINRVKRGTNYTWSGTPAGKFVPAANEK